MVARGPASFIHSQLFVTPPKPNKSITGQTAIVTGSNVGLGLEAARHLVSLGASPVILAVRDTAKGESAKASIEASTKCAADTVQVWALDLQSYASVQAFAARVEKELPRLDIALLNAGIATPTYRLAERDESTITTNVVSTFLLALLLLPRLRATSSQHYPAGSAARPTLTITSSEVHFFTKLPDGVAAVRDGTAGRLDGGVFARLSPEAGTTAAQQRDRYNVSKLLEVFVVREWGARMLADVTLNTVNPGLCHSELAREAGVALWLMKKLLARTTEEGSRTLVEAALGGPDTHGQYMSDSKVAGVSDFVLSDDGQKLQKAVWEELAAKLEGIQKGVTANL